MFVPAILLAALGLALCVFGWRGVRINRHPVCRRCRYELVGHDPLPATCPECGRALSQPCAVQLGTRRRLGLVVALGVLVVLGAGGLGVRSAWPRIQAFDWYTVRPNWMLVNDVEGLDTAKRDRALAEVLRRVTTDNIARPAASAWIDRALDAQGDLNRPWDPVWAQMIEGAVAHAWLDDPRLHRYLEQAVAETTLTRTNGPLPQGASIPMSVSFAPTRGPGASSLFAAEFRWERAEIDGRAVNVDSASRDGWFFTSRWPRRLPVRVAADTPPGAVTIEPIGTVYFIQTGPDPESPGRFFRSHKHTGGPVPTSKPPPVGTVHTASIGFPWAATVVRPEDIDLPPITDPAVAAKLREAIGVPRITAQPVAPYLYVHVAISTRGIAQPTAFDVVMRYGAAEHHVGVVRTGNPQLGSYSFGFQLAEDADLDAVDIEFQPNLGAWRELAGATGILRAPIIYEDVPVTWK